MSYSATSLGAPRLADHLDASRQLVVALLQVYYNVSGDHHHGGPSSAVRSNHHLI